MIGASKILTVSYGTFSCTLEGFDDPFNTMKAIAEYFRDLAAEDRYFGAEPPTPDAAMLHRIAEREIHRKVQATVDDRGVTLRAADVAELPSVQASAPVADPPSTEALPAVEHVVVVPMVAAAVAAPTVAEATEMPEGVAARLARIRAAVAEAEAAAAARYVEDEAEVVPSDLAALFAEPVEDSAPLPVKADVLPAPEPETSALHADPIMPADEATAGTPVEEADQAVDVFAMDMDIAELDETTESRVVPAFPADELDAQTDDPLFFDLLDDERAGALSTSDVADDLGPVDLTVDASVPELDDVQPAEAPDEARVADEPADAQDVATDVVAEIDAAGLADKAQRARARVIRIRRDAQSPLTAVVEEAKLADDPAAAHGHAKPEIVPEVLAEEDGDLIEAVDAIDAPVDDVLDDVLADAIGKAVAQADDARSAERAQETMPEAAPGAEDTALAQALSSILTDDEPAAAEAARPATTAPVEETAVSRLMEQTQTEMAVPENRRRLSAIAHLKAAVAATVAERLRFGRARTEVREETRSEAYRDDLARMVRPLRPEGADQDGSDKDGSDKADKAAPLVLVSSQRIDRPAPAPVPASTPAPVQSTPVRPRRIAGAAAAALLEDEEEGPVENIFSDTRGFAEFAENVGALALADLIEAAAAYASAVEGRDQFTRPQLMRQVESATGELQREDGLRSFGALLRDGRIVKVTRGRFAVTESSRFLAEARKLAG